LIAFGPERKGDLMDNSTRDISSSLLSVVVPVYNEEENLEALHERLVGVMQRLGCSYQMIMVDDGSKDRSLEVIKKIAGADANVSFISFTRNFGHESATSAGMDFADGDAVVIIDADLQDPPEVIEEMVRCWESGKDVVYGRRIRRPDEPARKRFSSYVFYRVMKRIAEVDIPLDTGDFRLMDQQMIENFKKLQEKTRFVRAQIAWLGGETGEVLYSREPRHAGKTKYTFRKRLQLSLDGLISFSAFPLHLVGILGLIVFLLSLIAALVVLFQKLVLGIAIPGYAFLVISVFFLGGTQMLLLGVLGEYLARIYVETKARPLYLISSVGGLKKGRGDGTGTLS
jgi:polyisoprenyl-phosphate glycosyltransferase